MKLTYPAPGAHGDLVSNGLGKWTPGETKDVPDHRENYARRLAKAGGFVIVPDAPPAVEPAPAPAPIRKRAPRTITEFLSETRTTDTEFEPEL